MGKKYYCEHCEKSMADNYETRRKHLNSANHKLLVKLHYNQFRDFKTLLQEESSKELCLRSLRNNCPFGDQCYNTHFTQDHLKEVEFQGQQLEQEALKKAQDKILKADLSNWFKSINTVPECFQNHLAREFFNPANSHLPPSLTEMTIEDVLKVDFIEWG